MRWWCKFVAASRRCGVACVSVTLRRPSRIISRRVSLWRFHSGSDPHSRSRDFVTAALARFSGGVPLGFRVDVTFFSTFPPTFFRRRDFFSRIIFQPVRTRVELQIEKTPSGPIFFRILIQKSPRFFVGYAWYHAYPTKTGGRNFIFRKLSWG